jgi:hypothetical protein
VISPAVLNYSAVSQARRPVHSGRFVFVTRGKALLGQIKTPNPPE